MGTVFSGALAYLLVRGPWVAKADTSLEAATWLGYGTLAVLLSVCGAFMTVLLATKRLVLTSEKLYVIRFFGLFRRGIPLEQIVRISSEPYDLTSTYQRTSITFHQGQQTVVQLLNKRTVRFTSFELGNYYTFTAHLENERRRFPAKLNYARLR